MTDHATLSDIRTVLALDRTGIPICPDRARIYAALRAAHSTGDPGLIFELLTAGFLAGASERFAVHVRPLLRHIEAATFRMGTDAAELGHFCGEVPCHQVELSAFAITRVTVTNALFALLDTSRTRVAADQREMPVVNVTWFDAAVFAEWVGCRLPSEAEWEYACGAGDQAQWCCGAGERLPDFAWYSENSAGRLHPVGTRQPNMLGLFDMPGNVWEWCQDNYAEDYYARAPVRDPVNEGADAPHPSTHKVARGGGFYALEEMCRTRFRLHDPAEYWARDLGFRLAQGHRVEAPTC